MSAPELSRPLSLDSLGSLPREIDIVAGAEERAALVSRFDLISLDALEAHFVLSADGKALRALGRLTATLVQACAATGEPVPVSINDVFELRFVDQAGFDPEAEVELTAHDCDTIEHDGQQIDLGEAVAQSLGLAIDPFIRAPNAEEILRAAGVVTEVEKLNPFAVLANKKS
jgi:uncharacterized metal-binding protein YceD (DUF177 family)